MSVLYFNGFETGDASQMAALASGQSIQSSIVRTGGYAAQLNNEAATPVETLLVSGLSTTTLYLRFSLYVNRLANGSDGAGPLILVRGPAAEAGFYVGALHVAAGGTNLELVNLNSTSVGTVALPSEGVHHVIQVKAVASASGAGILELSINGVVQFTATGLTNIATWDQVILYTGLFTPQTSVVRYIIDDICLRDDAYPGLGRVIARQGKAGSPTYDAWTKTSSQTAAQVWSETPFSATNNAATTGAIAAAQTMFAGDVSAGTDPINGSDTINACRICAIAKTSGVASTITSTWKAAVYSTSGATSYATTGTWTPKSHSLIVAFVVSTLGSSPLDPTGVTGHGLTFTQIALTARLISTTHSVSVWVADAGASPTTTATTASYNGVSQTGGVVVEFEVEGADLSGGASAAIVQKPTNNGSGTAETVTLAAAGNSANRALIFGAQLSNAAQTATGSWTLTVGAAGNFNTPATGAAGMFNNTSFDTAGAMTGANVAWRMVGLEVKADLTSGGSMSLRRRVSAADTDQAVTLTTSDAFVQGAIFSETWANLIAMEIGAVKAVSYQSRTQTVEDVWLMVDYTPGSGRTTKNTRAWPLGVNVGMGWRMPA